VPSATPSAAPSAAPSPNHCTDGVKNAEESDVDCGGPLGVCGRCTLGGACEVGEDCEEETCIGGECIAMPSAAPSVPPTASPTTQPTTAPTMGPTVVGATLTVAVRARLTGVSKADFLLLVPMFEKDMATFYGVAEEKVLVVGVTEGSTGGEERKLQEASLEIDYVVISDDREQAAAIVSQTEGEGEGDGLSAMEAISASVETNAVLVLQRELVVGVVVEEVEQEFLAEEELQTMQEESEATFFIPVDTATMEEGGSPIMWILMALIVVGGGGVAWNERRKMKIKIYMSEQSEEEERKNRAEAETAASAAEAAAKAKAKAEAEAKALAFAQEAKKKADEEEKERKAKEELEKVRVERARAEEDLMRKEKQAKVAKEALGGDGKKGEELTEWLHNKEKEEEVDSDGDEELEAITHMKIK